jgi:hypothetical protein
MSQQLITFFLLSILIGRKINRSLVAAKIRK